jgi:hypothetical protein
MGLLEVSKVILLGVEGISDFLSLPEESMFSQSIKIENPDYKSL